MNFEFFKQFITKPEIDEIIIGIGVENVSFFFLLDNCFPQRRTQCLIICFELFFENIAFLNIKELINILKY